jgi:hypothetical protein
MTTLRGGCPRAVAAESGKARLGGGGLVGYAHGRRSQYEGRSRRDGSNPVYAWLGSVILFRRLRRGVSVASTLRTGIAIPIRFGPYQPLNR